MDMHDSASEAAFRTEARQFLATKGRDAPADLGAPTDDWEPLLASRKRWQRALFDNGWAAITWPVEHGGRGLGPVEQIIWNQECVQAKSPSSVNIVGIGMAGPAIIAHGTQAQKDRYLRPMLTGEEIWCQLFSEPGAGSDLAAVSTRAERDGDEWVVNGQKVWSSGAHFAQWGILLARTDPSVPKHKGITFFLLDMSSPGVTVRPLRQLNGESHFNEVYLDDVRIPDANRVGPAEGGWPVTVTTILSERMALGGSLGIFHVQDLIDLAHEVAKHAPDGRLDDELRREVAGVYAQHRCLEFLNARVISRLGAGQVPTAEGSVAKLAYTHMVTDAAQAAMSLLGPASVTETSAWQRLFLIAPGMRVGGGTDEVQKNALAERVLGLPKEASRDRELPFEELPRQ